VAGAKKVRTPGKHNRPIVPLRGGLREHKGKTLAEIDDPKK